MFLLLQKVVIFKTKKGGYPYSNEDLFVENVVKEEFSSNLALIVKPIKSKMRLINKFVVDDISDMISM